jgi:hypothetical protein
MGSTLDEDEAGGGRGGEVKNSITSSIRLGGGRLRPFMMATKSARTCGDGKRAQTAGKAKRRKGGKGEKAKRRERWERWERRKGRGQEGPGRAREASHRGLLDFSAPMVEEKAP